MDNDKFDGLELLFPITVSPKVFYYSYTTAIRQYYSHMQYCYVQNSHFVFALCAVAVFLTYSVPNESLAIIQPIQIQNIHYPNIAEGLVLNANTAVKVNLGKFWNGFP